MTLAKPGSAPNSAMFREKTRSRITSSSKPGYSLATQRCATCTRSWRMEMMLDRVRSSVAESAIDEERTSSRGKGAGLSRSMAGITRTRARRNPLDLT